ncbi:hypothetical protein MRS45_14810 [Pseudomonas viridiflava]|uniref:hypothetical protein n=1 Tax=Pseudomonas viridiflava TaxID=33069 RepID=UPI000F022FB6|nr:hypothetical protein [Pseudomonas viridiflava]MCJ8177366.1 hypothetical protein [Pseudomonas viridiflava]
MAAVKNDTPSAYEAVRQLEPVAKPASPPTASAPATRTYRDKLYTSRTLILADNRTLAIAAGQATVPADDTVALDYLHQHPDFEPLE